MSLAFFLNDTHNFKSTIWYTSDHQPDTGERCLFWKINNFVLSCKFFWSIFALDLNIILHYTTGKKYSISLQIMKNFEDIVKTLNNLIKIRTLNFWIPWNGSQPVLPYIESVYVHGRDSWFQIYLSQQLHATTEDKCR